MALEDIFPGLGQVAYQVTSPASKNYNCIAWAVGDDDHWWKPTGKDFWPEEAPQEYTVAALIRAYETRGFVLCTDSTPEENHEKIAIYCQSQKYTHAARQLANGNWTSKLGSAEDIEHATLEALEGFEYGAVLHIMKRPKPS
jgi:hypothetical protein